MHSSRREWCSRTDVIVSGMGNSYAELERYCQEITLHELAGISVAPQLIPRVLTQLRGASICVTALIGYPFGAWPIEAKILEAEEAFERGANAAEMVLNADVLAEGDYKLIGEEIERFVSVCRGKVSGLVLEIDHLTNEEKKALCKLAMDLQVDYISTSTGFLSEQGPSTEEVALLRRMLGDSVLLKAVCAGELGADIEALIRHGAGLIGIPAAKLSCLISNL